MDAWMKQLVQPFVLISSSFNFTCPVPQHLALPPHPPSFLSSSCPCAAPQLRIDAPLLSIFPSPLLHPPSLRYLGGVQQSPINPKDTGGG